MAETLLSWLEVGFLVGLLYAPVAIGLAWSFRILNYPDLTCEGTFILSGALSIVVLNNTGSTLLAVLSAIAAGVLSGGLTAVINLHFKVSRLLSGIISWAILYSITIRLLGGMSNIRAQSPTLFNNFNSNNTEHADLLIALVATLLATIVAVLLSISRWGRLVKASGDQPWFVTSLGLSQSTITLAGLALANGFIGYAGAVVCQYRGICDVNMGAGILIAGLAAVILGEAVINARRVSQHIASVVCGAIFYNLAISAFYFDWGIGLESLFLPSDVRFFSGLLLLIPAAIVARRNGRYRLYSSEW